MHRRFTGGACYVNVGQGPRAVFKALQNGNYPQDIEAASVAVSGKNVRLGAYGDPAAIPFDAWAKRLENVNNVTGYTHQWRNLSNRELMRFCMASCDSAQDYKEATALGFRSFRVRGENEATLNGEFVCPASAENNKALTCSQCMACNGGLDTRKASPVIIAHGILKKRFIPILAA
jgi:hypothetical protein